MAYLEMFPLSQGEATFFPVTPSHFDGQILMAPEMDGDSYIIAHSESGHHHVIDCTDADVTRTQPDSLGMSILRVIVTNPSGAVVRNRCAGGHADLLLSPGTYEVRLNRELGLDDMIRRTAD